MYFCPKCNYIFDISKSVNERDDKIPLKKIINAFKVFDEKGDFANYKAEFKLEDLEKNVRYNKLSNEDKSKFNKLFEVSGLIGAQFICTNCNYIKNIDETILLYEYSLEESNNKIKNLEDNRLFCLNPTLPRTRDYICKNISCSTNKEKKDNKTKEKNNKNNDTSIIKDNDIYRKEAVFFREKDNFKINYICCICYYNW